MSIIWIIWIEINKLKLYTNLSTFKLLTFTRHILELKKFNKVYKI